MGNENHNMNRVRISTLAFKGEINMRKLKTTNKVNHSIKKNKKYLGFMCAGLFGILGMAQVSQVAHANNDVVTSTTVEGILEEVPFVKDVDALKADIQAQYGTTDELQVIYEDERIKEELNPVTGDYIYTDKINDFTMTYNEYELTEEEEMLSKMTVEEQIAYQKQQIKEQYGTENKFVVTEEDENYKEEINPATGDYRVTDKLTGFVHTDNYFDVLENVK